MASLIEAYKRTGKFEGGYANNKNDSGGETYFGISRVHNPTWKGWVIVDAQKKKSNFPSNLKDKRPELERLELNLYKLNYWDKVWGDKIQNQLVANDMYDTAVNMGVGTSIKLSERQFKLKETGVMSEALLNKLNSIMK